MGPVNLRAKLEEKIISHSIEELEMEKLDLVQAIDKLRLAINKINDEGKNRLLKASSNSTNKAKILLPVLNAFVAPIFPLPIFLISPYPHKFVKIKPNGIDPIK